jgi:hypothetical protein
VILPERPKLPDARLYSAVHKKVKNLCATHKSQGCAEYLRMAQGFLNLLETPAA